MSIENSEERNLSLPDIPPDHPANAGSIGGMQNLLNVPPPDWGEPQLAGAVGTALAGEAGALASNSRKPRVTKAKDQTTDAADRAQQADAVAKPPRKARVIAKAADAGAQVQRAGAEAAKPTRSRRKAAPKAPVAQKQGLSAARSAPAIGGSAIQSLTAEAITFLSNPDSPAFEKVADALLAQFDKNSRAGVKPTFTPPRETAPQVSRVSYRPKMAQTMAYQATAVQLGKMDVRPDKSRAEEHEANAVPAAADIQRANGVIGTSLLMLSAPIGDVTREQAADLIAGDLEDVRVIKDVRARQLAFSAMIESGHAQPHYKDAFERLAPELVAPAKEANADLEADRAVWHAAIRSAPHDAKQKAENTIERGIAPELDNQPAKDSQSTPSVESAAPCVAQPSHPSSLGRRMLRAFAAWLQDKAEDKRARAQAPGATPLSLGKQATPATPAGAKANLVPDSVAQRFLKVERDYYFPDKTLAFSDQGNKLATRGAHPEVVRSLIEIARARGWDSITVKGTDEFRRGAWMEATQAGLMVAGYKPTALDFAELGSKPAANTVEKGSPNGREAAATKKERTQPSKAGTAEQAPQAAEPAPSPELAAKARAFEKEKPGFVMKKFPELAQAYGVVDAAKKFAEANLLPEVRVEFVSLARRHVMQKILAGEQVRGPKIYAPAAKTNEGVEQTHVPTQPAADLGKAARSMEVARER